MITGQLDPAPEREGVPRKFGLSHGLWCRYFDARRRPARGVCQCLAYVIPRAS